MNRKFASFIAAGFLITGCATAPKPHDWAHDVQTAETREAHQKLAEHYEDVARQMKAEADEERRILDQYQRKPYLYGKRIHDLSSHTNAMIMDFEAAAKESRQMAEYHRQLAGEMKR
jgi:outer membrane murein-binding lipoprotein Lpp